MEIKSTNSFQNIDLTKKQNLKPAETGLPKDKLVKSVSADPDIAKMEQLSRRTRDATDVILNADSKKEALRLYELWEVGQSGSPNSNTLYDPKTNTAYTAMGGIGNAYLTAIDKEGNVKWTFGEEVVSRFNSPVMDGKGNLYFRSEWKVYSVDKDGKKKWDFPVQRHAGTSEAPIKVGKDGTVYATTTSLSGKLTLMAIKEENGKPKVKWTYETHNNVHNKNPLEVVEDGTVYVCGIEKDAKTEVSRDFPFIEVKDYDQAKVIALNPDTGGEMFKVDVAKRMAGKSFLTEGPEGRVYIAHGIENKESWKRDDHNRITAFSKTWNGWKKWDYDLPIKPGQSGGFDQIYLDQAPCVDDEGNIYVASNAMGSYPDGHLVCLDTSGEEKWKITINNDRFTTKPQVGPDGNIYVGSKNGDLHIYDKKGKFKNKIHVGEMNSNNFSFGTDGEVILNTRFRTVAIQPDIKKIPKKAWEKLKELDKNREQKTPEEMLRIEKEEDFVVIGGVKLPKRKK